MYELIYRSLSKRTSREEEAELRAWRAAAPDHELQYQEWVRLCELAGETLRAPDPPPPPGAALLIRRAATGTSPTLQPRVRRFRPVELWGGSVTALTAAAIAWVLLVPAMRENSSGALLGEEYVTAAAQSETVILGDGTVVRLGPQSRLRLAGADRPREVYLDGTAYFVVKSRPEAPFKVRTDHGEAVVLGTRFELRTRRSDLRLLVFEGRVALEAEHGPVVVAAGQMSHISEGRAASPAEVDDLRTLVPWLQRFIVFQSTPLAEAVEELEREYGVTVHIRDRALATQTLTGWYADRQFGEIFGLICGVLQASCSFENGIATMERG
jgi:ferric-dicitrate binding protein FerR (iron transport regulator)